jgi:DNA-binding transcriptional ArsR family regulator
MAAKERRNLSDPKELRALAHPLRVRLLYLIGQEGSLTATQCAAAVGESVANCSYHLNQLAKYNYIRQAEGGQGREKPWEVAHEGRSWSDVSDDPEVALAAEAASNAVLDFAIDTIRERFQLARLEPENWREAVGFSDSSEYLTSDEAQAMRQEIEEIMRRYKERRDNPAVRPEGARPVYFFLATTVAPRERSLRSEP